MKLNSLDRSQSHKTNSADGSRSTNAYRCSVQEGVRMMVTPSMFMSSNTAQERAILNPPVTVQRAVVVTQEAFEVSKTVTTATAIEPTNNDISPDVSGVDTVAVKLAKGNGRPFQFCNIYMGTE